MIVLQEKCPITAYIYIQVRIKYPITAYIYIQECIKYSIITYIYIQVCVNRKLPLTPITPYFDLL